MTIPVQFVRADYQGTNDTINIVTASFTERQQQVLLSLLAYISFRENWLEMTDNNWDNISQLIATIERKVLGV